MLSADAEEYYETLAEMAKTGELTSELRHYLEDCIAKKRETPFQRGMLQALLQDIKDAAFVPPLMPSYILVFYDSVVLRIANELCAPKQQESAAASTERSGKLSDCRKMVCSLALSWNY